MAKRFTDTNKWKKQFIKDLDVNYKLLWFYILDDCDYAGIWDVDIDVASLRIGLNINEVTALEKFKDHVFVIEEDKWFIYDFVEFQYGKLNSLNRAHKAVINRLKKCNLLSNENALIIPVQAPYVGAKDKDKVTVIVKENKEAIADCPNNLSEIITEAKRIGYNMTKEDAERFMAHYDAINWLVSNQPCRNWKPLVIKWKVNKYERDQKELLNETKSDLDKRMDALHGKYES